MLKPTVTAFIILSLTALVGIGQNTDLPACTPTEHTVEARSYTSKAAHVTVSVLKIHEDAQWGIYGVKLCALRVRNVGNYFACDMAVWTPGVAEADVLTYAPTTRVPAGILRFDVPGKQISLPVHTDCPGAWTVTPVKYVKDEWHCSQVSSELVFETTFCWEVLSVATVWKIPAGVKAFIDINCELITAPGWCLAKTRDPELLHFYVRIPILEIGAEGDSNE